MSLRSMLYAAARLLGDANAIAKGRIIQRAGRIAAWRGFGSIMGRWFR